MDRREQSSARTWRMALLKFAAYFYIGRAGMLRANDEVLGGHHRRRWRMECAIDPTQLRAFFRVKRVGSADLLLRVHLPRTVARLPAVSDNVWCLFLLLSFWPWIARETASSGGHLQMVLPASIVPTATMRYTSRRVLRVELLDASSGSGARARGHPRTALWPSATKRGGAAAVAYHARDHEVWIHMAARGHMHMRGGGTVVCALDPLRNKQPHLLYERLDGMEQTGVRVFLLRAQASIDGEAAEAVVVDIEGVEAAESEVAEREVAESEDDWGDARSVVNMAASVLACEHFHISTVFTSLCEERLLAPWRALFSCIGVSLLTYSSAHET